MVEKTEKAQTGGADAAHVDRVLGVSRHPDGSPAQTPGFKSVHQERTAAISEAQLREHAASAVDYAARSALVADEPDLGEPDAWIKSLSDAQEKASDSAAKKVEKLDA